MLADLAAAIQTQWPEPSPSDALQPGAEVLKPQEAAAGSGPKREEPEIVASTIAAPKSAKARNE